MSARLPKAAIPGRFEYSIMLTVEIYAAARRIKKQQLSNNKAKPAERRGRKATGPRFLREATEDLPKDPKIAGLPTLQQ